MQESVSSFPWWGDFLLKCVCVILQSIFTVCVFCLMLFNMAALKKTQHVSDFLENGCTEGVCVGSRSQMRVRLCLIRRLIVLWSGVTAARVRFLHLRLPAVTRGRTLSVREYLRQSPAEATCV